MCNDKSKCHLDMGRGCCFCEQCGEAGVEACEGCFKLHESDWLAAYPDQIPTDIFEVRFKNTRKGYYQNVNNLELKAGDIVAVEASPGHDIGIISLTGDMVGRQMKRVGFTPVGGEFRKIYRKAKPFDIEKWQEAIALEHDTMIRSRRIAAEMGLDMKIGDVEYQGDKIKAIFYYIADGRVDFRELIKVFAEQFRIKIEMKQIGARQEAGRIGGLGSCGRQLCCASWVSSFSSVTTNAARTQDLSLNPQKLAGQCGKLKCCLVYELDSYIDARKSLPRLHEPLHAMDGDYYLVSTDVLARTMGFATTPDAGIPTVTLSAAKVRDILEINRQGRKVDTIEGETKQVKEEIQFASGSDEDSISRFDAAKRKKHRGGKGRRQGGDRGVQQPATTEAQSSDAVGDNKPSVKPSAPQGQPQQRKPDDRRQSGPRRNNDRNRRNGQPRQQQSQQQQPQQHKPEPPKGSDQTNKE